MAQLPFASVEGVQKVIEHMNRQNERLNALALINVELTKLLVASGSIERTKLLEVLQEIEAAQTRGNSKEGAEYTQKLRTIVEQQTKGPQSEQV